MSDLARLQSRRFRLEHEEDWRRLEQVLGRIERGGVASLREPEIVSLPTLYRAALSSLSIARAISLDAALVEYLESLCARAYFAVYGERKSLGGLLGRFFRKDWPAAVVALGPELLVAAALLLGAAAIAFLLVRSDATFFSAFLGPGEAQGRSPAASADILQKALHGRQEGGMLAVFAGFLFTHNAQVALTAFAVGIFGGAPTLLLVMQNGLGLGALLEVYAVKGLLLPLAAWLSIHGVTELSAIVLAAAGGLRLGRTLLFPGRRARSEALRAEGRTAAHALGGVVVMLLVAGLLEGIGRQVIQSDGARLAVGAGTAVFWGAYLLGPLGRRT